MSWVSALFVLMLVAIGGVVAYLADRLGRTLGKKRLSVFGMRPRHTAEFLTVCAGAAIPLVTFAIVMFASAGARDWFLHAAEWRQQRDTAYVEVNRANSDLRTIRVTLETEKGQLTKTDQDLKASIAQVDQLTKKQQELQKEVAIQSGKAKLAQTQYEAARRQFAAVNGQLLTVRTSYDSLKHNFGKLQADDSALSSNYDKLKQSYANLDVLRKDAEKQVASENEQVARLADQLKAQQSQLADAKNEYASTKNDLDSAREALDETRKVLDQTRNDLAMAQSQYSFITHGVLEPELKASRLQPIMFSVGEELARIEVPAGLSDSEAQTYVAQLLRMADAVAKQQGAAGNPSAGLVDFDEKQTAAYQESQTVSAIRGSKESTVVVANAFYNTFNGEKVPVLLHVMQNPLVYRKDQVIADTLVRGDLSEGQIFTSISEFVRTKVRDRATKDKMIPVMGKEDSFGQVLPGDILTLVSEIKKWDRPARLVALAQQDTRAADPLGLKFELR